MPGLNWETSEQRTSKEVICSGWQTSRGYKGQIFVDKKGEFLGTFFDEFSWIFLVSFHGHFFYIIYYQAIT